MNMNRFSIKHLTLFNLAVIGVLVIALSIVVGAVFRQAAVDEEGQVLSRVIDVAARQILADLERQGGDLGTAAQKDRNLRALAGGRANADRAAAVSALDEQFHQYAVTSGKVNLLKLRLYDKALKPVASSSEGVDGLPAGLPQFLREQALGRKGAARFRVIGGAWSAAGQPAYSVLVPVGGLRLSGYLEVVLDPVPNLQHVADILGSPFAILRPGDGEVLHRSEDWPEGGVGEDRLVVTHTFTGDDGKPLVVLESLEDVSDMYAVFDRTQWLNVGGFVLIIALGVAFSLFMFGRYLFGPLGRLMGDLERIAGGDLTIDVRPEGLCEVHALGRSLASMVERLREQVALIQGNAAELASAAEELSLVTGETRAGVERQRDETDQVATAMNEMTSTVQEVSSHAEGAAEAAREADGKSAHGRVVVEQAIERIDALAREIEQAAGVIHQLEEESENITRVMDVIQGIAEQTNLLALNAAIEAARAGEQGRGFAVVADEVRTLASRTQESTQEIQQMIERLQSGAGAAVKAMVAAKEQAEETVEQAAGAGTALQAIAEATTAISDMNTQIASAAEEQAQVAEEINRSIARISEIADQTAGGSEQTAQASESLARLAAQLQGVAAQFKV